MIIKKAVFVQSSKKPDSYPKTDKPEFAFVGRSNVGKSSLLNMLANVKKLAKTSGTPGKTKLINHFLINDEWCLVDLPGYGYARTSKEIRNEFLSLIYEYLQERMNLYCLFVLIDSRHTPQQNDLDFLEWLGKHKIPFVICFTKTDKLTKLHLEKRIEAYTQELGKYWEPLPEFFLTSVVTTQGRDEILNFMEKTLKS